MPRPEPADIPHSQPSRTGVLYCFTHPVMHGLCKVGATRKHPIQRAAELSAGTGVPGDFVVAYWRGFRDCFEAERLTHEAFAEHRVDQQREFFRLGVGEVAAFVRALEVASTGREGGEWLDSGEAFVAGAAETARLYPWATLFARFNEDPDVPGELTAEERAQCEALRLALRRETPVT